MMPTDRDSHIEDGVENRRSMGDAVERILQDLQVIFHEQVQLAASEMKEKAQKSRKAGVFLGGAAVMGFLAAECMITTFIVALAIVLPLWLAALLMAVMLGGAAGGAYMMGRLALEEVDLLPQKTLETLRDNVDWAKNRVS